MLTKKHVAEIHGTEFMFRTSQHSKAYTTVVLAKVGEGCSFKPYPKDKIERQEIIADMAIAGKCTLIEAARILDDPTYCFARTYPHTKIDFVRRVIKEGHADFATNVGLGARCPFA